MIRALVFYALLFALIGLGPLGVAKGESKEPLWAWDTRPADDLIAASKEGYVDRVRHLLKTNPDIDINKRDATTGKTALVHAAFGHRKNVVKLLLQQPGINPDAKDTQGYTPLLATFKSINLMRTPASSATAIVKRLLECEKCHRVDVNARGPDGWTPLTSTAFMGHWDTALLLIEHPDIDVNVAGGGGTPLIHAARRHSEETDIVGQFLLGNHIILSLIMWHHSAIKDINARDAMGYTALAAAAAAYFPADSPENGIGVLLAMPNIDVNVRVKDGSTPLILAVKAGKGTDVRTLLRHSEVDVHARDVKGHTALWHAKNIKNTRHREEIIDSLKYAAAKKETSCTKLLQSKEL